MELNGLPVYEIVVDENDVRFIALVDKPAIQKNFIAFKEQSKLSFDIVSDEKRIISGPVLLSDTPIYRKPPQVPTEGYIVFSKDAIMCIAQKFFKDGNQANVNLMHDASLQMDGVTMFESWITDFTRGVLPLKGFEDAPDGSWFGSFKVDNPVVWELIKAGEIKGFSTEGAFTYVKPDDIKDDEFLEELREVLKIVNE